MTKPESRLMGKFVSNPEGVHCQMEFDGKGKLVLTRDGEFVVEAMYRIIEDRIEIVDCRGPRAHPDDGKGVYRWKLEGEELTFSVIQDIATGRSRFLTAQPHHLEARSHPPEESPQPPFNPVINADGLNRDQVKEIWAQALESYKLEAPTIEEKDLVEERQRRMHDLSIELAALRNLWMQHKKSFDLEDKDKILTRYKETHRELRRLIKEIANSQEELAA